MVKIMERIKRIPAQGMSLYGILIRTSFEGRPVIMVLKSQKPHLLDEPSPS